MIDQLKELQNTAPVINYRIFDKEIKKMFTVKNIKYGFIGKLISITVEGEKGEDITYYDLTKIILIPSTGFQTKDKDELFFGDFVICYFMEKEAVPRMIFWDNGWRVMGCTTEEFASNVEDGISLFGNRFEHETLLEEYKKMFDVKR